MPRLMILLLAASLSVVCSCTDNAPVPKTPATPAAQQPREVQPQPQPQPAAAPHQPVRPLPAVNGALMLILDTSCSMEELAENNRSRLAVMQDVMLNDFVPLIDDAMLLGLITFNDEQARFNQQLAQAGALRKPDWTHKELLMESVQRTKPSGGTPIVASLRAAQGALQDTAVEPRTVVLLTDGEESYAAEQVAPTITQLRAAGITVFAIGFNIGEGGQPLADALADHYLPADGGREALMQALRPVLAAIER